MVSPSVLLAIFSATANVCLGFAHSQGAVVAWWRKALRGGTLEDLSHYWEFGDSLLAAGLSGRKFNFVALATLAASAVMVDEPLLQKASTIVSKPMTKAVNVTAPIALEIPYGFTGMGNAYGGSQAMIMNQTFAQIVNAYTTRIPIKTGFTGCAGNCSGTIKAAGLAINCSSASVPWNNNGTSSTNVGDGEVFTSSFDWFPANGTNGTYPMEGNPWINFDLLYVTDRTAASWYGDQSKPDLSNENRGACNGTLVRQRCTLLSATLNYPIVLVNDIVTLPGNSITFPVDHIQAVGVPSDFMDQHDLNTISFTTLGGVGLAAQNMFNSIAIQDRYSIQVNGSLGSQYSVFDNGPTSYIASQDACSINWRDPTSDIMNALNEIMFRTALATSDISKYSVLNYSITDAWTSFYEAYPVTYPEQPKDNGISVPQNITMEQTVNVNVFQSHYGFLAGALAVMVIGVFLVIPTFIGFWELGRDPSLNPLELAKAFNAAILYGPGSNARVGDLLVEFGKKEVKYGEVVDDGTNDSRTAREPDNGLSSGDLIFRRRRLEFADPNRVKNPEFHAVYN